MTPLDNDSRFGNWRTRVRLLCPACIEEFVVMDLDKFLYRARFLWRLLLININEVATKQKLFGTLAIITSHESTIQDMDDKGAAPDFYFGCIGSIRVLLSAYTN